jgi:hypothetical protein
MVGGTAYRAGGPSGQDAEAEAKQGATVAGLNAQTSAASAPGITDVMLEQLRKLADLKDEGVLTQEEFDVQKRRLLQAT